MSSSLLDPTTWSLKSFLGISEDAPRILALKRLGVLCSVYGCVIGIVCFWLRQVTRYVPQPYLDEFFHIPQAQAYCKGDIWSWDPKITTPPGLYAVSALAIRYLKGGICTTLELRSVSSTALLLLFYTATQCRRLIEQTQISRPYSSSSSLVSSASVSNSASTNQSSWSALHTALNIALFPPLFFFSSLYYTDVLSTCVVVAGYYQFLNLSHENSKKGNTFFTGLVMYVWGVAALFMRQTNVFWAAIFLAALEWVRCCEGKNLPATSTKTSDGGIQEMLETIKGYSRGQLHDPFLDEASILDAFWCALSIGVSALFNPILLLKKIWPYVGLLISFAAFVAWNGGVVLGDKSNHVATIHLPQMLYIWPFMAFFSAPLLISSVVNILQYFVSTFAPSLLPNGHAKSKKINIWAVIQNAVFSLIALFVALIIVHYNTIIHPFTLADNRHYVFYAFRYTIRQHRLVKYLLTPVYLLSGYLIIGCLASSSYSNSSSKSATSTPPTQGTSSRAGRRSHPNRRQHSEADSYVLTEKSNNESSLPSRQNGVRLSFLLIWLLSTALSLITAPLVEPRYFIIPWVMWRLHVPSLSQTESSSTASSSMSRQESGAGKTGYASKNLEASSWVDIVKNGIYRKHDYRLWIETIWFLVINAVTGYIFLFRGFEWPQEPGKVQRFMW